MSERIPLFPLGSVLFPGLVLPLHIFEERYRALVRDLLERPENERKFGVVAITLGHEVGASAALRTAEVGSVAELREVEPYEDGRYDIVAAGSTRFRLEAVDDSLPYLRADVTLLGEGEGDEPGAYVAGVRMLFHRYCSLLSSLGASVRTPEELPEEPVRLSYLVAAAVLLGRQERQELLEAADAASRLRREIALLRREISVLRGVSALPAYDLLSKDVSQN